MENGRGCITIELRRERMDNQTCPNCGEGHKHTACSIKTTVSESPSVTGSAACFDGAQDALNRMKRAHQRGTGCHLTARMLQSLYVSFMGEMWGADDPREKP